MTALLGTYFFWRVARRLVPLVLALALAVVLLAPGHREAGAAGRLRGQVHSLVGNGQRALERALSSSGSHR